MRMFKGLLLSVLLSALLIGLLNVMKSNAARDDVAAIEVAAGGYDRGEDLASPDPLVHCYPGSGADDLPIRERVDFEARTSDNWVLAPDEADEGEFCLIESPQAVEKRLAAAADD